MTASPLDWLAIAPALVVILTGMLVVGVDLVFPHPAAKDLDGGHRGRALLVLLSMGGLVWPAFRLVDRLMRARAPYDAFGGALIMDDYGNLLSLGILAATALVLLGAHVDTRRRGIAFGEYYGLLLTSAGGMMLLVQAGDFLTMFITLEILSLALYVLTGITRRNPRANEAAVKYLVMGAFATGFLLMGVAFIYGSSGTIVLREVGKLLATNRDLPLMQVGFGLLLVGFGFKIGAVPFHMWVPDVYQGAPTTTTAFMSVAVKTAGVGALGRVLVAGASARPEMWSDLLLIAAVATMVVGNLLAMPQTSVKRMLAYSSIAHTGYALVALATLRATNGVFSADGVAAVMVYLLMYTFMTLGAFMCLVYLGHQVERPGHPPEWQDAEHLDDLAGAGVRHPWAALAMTIFLVSLGGIPPTAGFFGKFMVFASAIEHGHVGVAVIGVLASLTSLYYYLKVVVAMYMREPVATDERPHALIGWVIGLAAVGTLVLGVIPNALVEVAMRSVLQLTS